jgi:FkbM family methyltransferase
LRVSIVVPVRLYIRFVPSAFGKEWLWRALVAHLWLLERDVKARMWTGQTISVDASDIVGRYIYYFGVWEPNLTAWLRRTLSIGDVFVDVGANVGYFSLMASRLVGTEGRAVAIEALPGTYQRLQSNIDANRATNVRAVCIAAWDAETTLEFFTRADGTAGTTTAYAEWAERWNLIPVERVRAQPLATVLSVDEIARVRVIKIDAEGAEWRVLKGLAQVLEQCRDDLAIVMELAPELLRKDHSSPEAIAAFLLPYGFHPYRLENDYAASAYLRGDVQAPVRIKTFPTDCEQFDVIFSRTGTQQL